jgi:hypothetical protein
MLSRTRRAADSRDFPPSHPVSFRPCRAIRKDQGGERWAGAQAQKTRRATRPICAQHLDDATGADASCCVRTTSPTDSTLVLKTRLRSLRVLHPTQALRTESTPGGRLQPAIFVPRYSRCKRGWASYVSQSYELTRRQYRRFASRSLLLQKAEAKSSD